NFGSAVALDFNTILVGAGGKKIGSNFSQGAAYVFTRSDTTWNQQWRLAASDGAGADKFGKSVASVGGPVPILAGAATIGSAPASKRVAGIPVAARPTSSRVRVVPPSHSALAVCPTALSAMPTTKP